MTAMNDGGFTRYYFGPDIVLSSESYEQAKIKIEALNGDLISKGAKKEGLYYKNNILWKEYQFLFLIQYIEFKTAEFIGTLSDDRKVKIEFIKELEKNTKIDKERRVDISRIFSPYVLLVKLEYNLGRLIKLIKKETLDFDNKQALLKKLCKFNYEYRNNFVHRIFINSINSVKIIQEGIASGKEILKDLEDMKKHEQVQEL